MSYNTTVVPLPSSPTFWLRRAGLTVSAKGFVGGWTR